MAGELDTLLTEFAKRHDLAKPQADANGRYFLLLDGELEVALLQGGDRIYLEGRLGPLPADAHEAEELLGRYLRLHLSRLRDHREVLSLEPDSDHLTLFRLLPARALAMTEFEQALSDFANNLEFWTSNAVEPVRTWAPLPTPQMIFP